MHKQKHIASNGSRIICESGTVSYSILCRVIDRKSLALASGKNCRKSAYAKHILPLQMEISIFDSRKKKKKHKNSKRLWKKEDVVSSDD